VLAVTSSESVVHVQIEAGDQAIYESRIVRGLARIEAQVLQ
jgi:hypothetical protein